MLLRRLISFSAGLMLLGCTYRDPSVDLMENELRWMEDQVYMLEDELQSAHHQLADCQSCSSQPTPAYAPESRSGKLKSDYSIIQEEPSAPRSTKPKFEKLPTTNTRPKYSIVPEDKDAEPEYQIVEPTVELPPESDSPNPAEQPQSLPIPGRRPLLDESDADAGTLEPPGGEVELQSFYWEEPMSTEEGDLQPTDSVDANVTHIVATGTITEGYDFDNQPCPPGVLVVVQPRNAAGEFVALPGPLSVVVLDGTKSGAAARVARWDIEAAESRRKLRDTHYGNGIHLNLAWPDAPPDSQQLYLFVRYTTVEGRKLECDRMIGGRAAQQWTAAAKRLCAPPVPDSHAGDHENPTHSGQRQNRAASHSPGHPHGQGRPNGVVGSAD